MAYAFDDFKHLVGIVPGDDKATNYLCALISELAYYNIDQNELDAAKKRAKILVPCRAYRSLVRQGEVLNVPLYLGSEDGRTFVVSTLNTVALGFVIRDKVFLGYRGTYFAYDWKTNLDLVPSCQSLVSADGGARNGYVHRGFLEESIRINVLVREKLKSIGFDGIKEIYFTGHSLGGAIAALSPFMFPHYKHKNVVKLFGCPRYATLSHYTQTRFCLPEVIQRPGDIVPYVPFKTLGYIDHPRPKSVADAPLKQRYSDSICFLIWMMSRFAAKLSKPHTMEFYREDVGEIYGSELAAKPLIYYPKLKNR